jgi:hypothetical protein
MPNSSGVSVIWPEVCMCIYIYIYTLLYRFEDLD